VRDRAVPVDRKRAIRRACRSVHDPRRERGRPPGPSSAATALPLPAATRSTRSG